MSAKRSKACLWACVFLSIIALTGTALSAQKRPATVAELALYNGADRQQILEEGARKEGKLTFYTVHIVYKPIVAAFQKKYPFIKVETWRAGTTALTPRVLEEYKAGRHVVDVIDQSPITAIFFGEQGILQPFYSPNLPYIQEDAIKRSASGSAIAAGCWEIAIGMGYNTKIIPKAQVPKTYQELLDPKWRGKGVMSGSDSGRRLTGTLLTAYGEEFVKEFAKHNFAIHMVAGGEILNMVINGEYALSPTIYDSHVKKSREKGAPMDWMPLEPVYVTLGQVGLAVRAPNPHAAMLFLDFELSKEAGEIYRSNRDNSTRKDIFQQRAYKKFYGARTIEEQRKWDKLFVSLFMKK